jgi:aspartyl aminopeptidase
MSTPDTAITHDLADFIKAGPSPFHVTAEIARRLEAGGVLSRAAPRRGGRRGCQAVPGP